MAYSGSKAKINDLEAQNALPIESINQIARDTNTKLLNFLEANKGIDTFELKWKYELFKYKTYKTEEKLMLNEVKGEKSLKNLKEDGRKFLRSTRIASIVMHFNAMHEIDLFDKLKNFEDMANLARNFSKNFHNEILYEVGSFKNAKNKDITLEDALADKEAELNKNFESQYGALDDQKNLLRKGI